MGPTDTGAGSIEDERRRLKGTWELASLEVVSPAGERLTVPATGTLNYDDYGNLSMKGTINGGAEVDSSNLNFTGRIAIDPDKHMLRILDVESANADTRRVDPALDAKHVRYYEFTVDGLLKTTVKDTAGKTTATATWKKQS